MTGVRGQEYGRRVLEAFIANLTWAAPVGLLLAILASANVVAGAAAIVIVTTAAATIRTR